MSAVEIQLRGGDVPFLPKPEFARQTSVMLTEHVIRNGTSLCELTERDIHVWTFPTRGSGDSTALLERVLSSDEAERAARFRFDDLRESFVTARGVLRYLLGCYLHCNPVDVRFVYGPAGKPALSRDTAIQFNLAHSGDLAVLAVAARLSIGVDVEQIRELPDMQPIAQRFFCPQEATEIMLLPEGERARAFFCCWTRKEAYVKAIGAGLSLPLDSFRVTVEPGKPARFVHLEHNERAAEGWSLHDLQIASNYAAALAYPGPQKSVSVFPVIDPWQFVCQQASTDSASLQGMCDSE